MMRIELTYANFGKMLHNATDLACEPKISKNSVKNRPCLSNEVASLDDLAVRALILSEAGTVLIFCFVFVSRQKNEEEN